MKLEKFIKEQQKDILAFERWWTKKAAREPEQFPFELPLGEWFEHFLIFASMSDKDRRE